jgi:hypothetical protein
MERAVMKSLKVVPLVLLAACTTVPMAPSVLVLPGTGKTFETFDEDDALCQQWAAQKTGTTPRKSATEQTPTAAAIGTVIGAGAGAAIGAATGDAGAGAAIGGGSGLVLGTLTGADSGYGWGYEVQRRFDIAYQQCMYARGNRVPVDAVDTNLTSPLSSSSRPIPPPPPGEPPPPPPYP